MEIRTSDICLKEITASTVLSVISLRVSVEQEKFVSSNAVSIAQAHFSREAWFRAVCAGDRPVGFVMLSDPTLVSPAPVDPELSLWRFMIDHRSQGTGLGRKALALVLDHARSRPGVSKLHTSCVVGSNGPLEFYLAAGFQRTGELTSSGEVCLACELQ